ncbi:MAG: hypothetical protein JWQ76_5268 [Ramlibacter sp.]|nr:hypothetical protein [Ramlibacter sp.]
MSIRVSRRTAPALARRVAPPIFAPAAGVKAE